MIFAPSLAQRILDGQKTVTRRRLKHRGGREIRYKIGGVYAIQPGRGKRHIGHIQVRDVIAEPLAFLDEVDAVREGFRSAEEFYRYWAVLHRKVDRDEIVARIVFELVPGNGCCASWDATPLREVSNS